MDPFRVLNAAMRDNLTLALLVITSVGHVLLAVDRWVHKQTNDGASLSDRVSKVEERVSKIEHTVDAINARSSEINSTLQRMVGRLEAGRFRGDGFEHSS